MIDCHLHLQDDRLYPHSEKIMEELRRIGVTRLVVNGTCPEDWGRVAELSDLFPEVVPFFGLHPWRVNGAAEDWAETLSDWLDHYPDAGIGEIGLDKWIRDHDIEKQKREFRIQLELAGKTGRAVSVHCLQAWGHLLETLREGGTGRSTLLHSFAGPAEMVDDFVELGVYFSVSGYFFRADKADKLRVFAAVPDERLLVETDAPDMLPPRDWSLVPVAGDPGANHPANIAGIYRSLADWKGIDEERLVRRTSDNFEAWISG